ncbi:MAG: class I SAM-dependent methyltransferase [Dehalococcoidia bacterium]|nr:class I SAM-dependent methyltransferase [Dehalococcoidia bacterium]
MNSLGRELLLKHWDFPLFESLARKYGISLTDSTILDVGCGSGYTTLLISERFRPRKLQAFDVVPEQVERARTRGVQAEIFVADITDPHLPPRSFDAVFVCGVLHHCPEWRKGLAQTAALLKDGGLLFLEEPGKNHIRLETLLMGHPPAGGAWLGLEEIRQEMPRLGLSTLEERPLYFGLFGAFLCVKKAAEHSVDYISARELLRVRQTGKIAAGQEVPA